MSHPRGARHASSAFAARGMQPATLWQLPRGKHPSPWLVSELNQTPQRRVPPSLHHPESGVLELLVASCHAHTHRMRFASAVQERGETAKADPRSHCGSWKHEGLGSHRHIVQAHSSQSREETLPTVQMHFAQTLEGCSLALGSPSQGSTSLRFFQTWLSPGSLSPGSPFQGSLFLGSPFPGCSFRGSLSLDICSGFRPSGMRRAESCGFHPGWRDVILTPPPCFLATPNPGSLRGHRAAIPLRQRVS